MLELLGFITNAVIWSFIIGAVIATIADHWDQPPAGKTFRPPGYRVPPTNYRREDSHD